MQPDPFSALAALVAQHTNRAVMVLDPRGTIEWVNKGFCDLTGYGPSDVQGKPATFLYSQCADNPGSKLIEQCIRASAGADATVSYCTQSGVPLWIRSEIRPVRDSRGELTHFVVLQLDLQEEERAARQIHEDEERGMLALEINDVAVWDLDVVSQSVSGSRRWTEILGLGSEEIVVDDLALIGDRMHPDEQQAFAEAWEALLAGTIPALDLGTRLRVGVTYRYMRMRARVIRRDDCGKALRIVGTLSDVHEATLMQMQAVNASKLESIGELAAGIAHEINTPTQYVGDNVNFLKDSFAAILQCLDRLSTLSAQHATAPLGAQLRRELEAADLPFLREEIPSAISQSLEGIARIARIVGAMKEFSHPSQERTPTDLNRAISNTITVATNEWKYVARVETDFDAALPEVCVVPGAFNQVVLNIIVNAAHAIAEGRGKQDDGLPLGTIRVTTRHVPGWAEVRISDDGCGMPHQVQQKTFDPFFTTKPVGKGTGQGLSIAHNVIVKQHHGTLSVDSEPGRGTTFTVRLPLKADASANAA